MLRTIGGFFITGIVLLVIGLTVGNYFWGTPAEKERSTKIFAKVKDLGGEVYDLLAAEKQKLDEGHYDEAKGYALAALKKVHQQVALLLADPSNSAQAQSLRQIDEKASQLEVAADTAFSTNHGNDIHNELQALEASLMQVQSRN